MLKTILIDDEPLALSRLRRLLTHFPDHFQVIGEARNGMEGLEQIRTLQPDLIFLDIEMPEMNGFDMLAQLTHMPLVVFATAYDHYAIRAFEENSIDYLLKPIELDRLDKTVAKLKQWQAQPTTNPFDANLLELLGKLKPKKDIHAISVKIGERIIFIPLSEISHFEAEDKYVYLFTLGGKKHLAAYTITVLEEKLPDYFVRISRSAIVNSIEIKELQRDLNGRFTIQMKDTLQTRLRSGLSYGDQVKKLFL